MFIVELYGCSSRGSCSYKSGMAIPKSQFCFLYFGHLTSNLFFSWGKEEKVADLAKCIETFPTEERVNMRRKERELGTVFHPIQWDIKWSVSFVK